MTPSISPSNATLSFSSGAQTAYTGLAATVRFNTTGTIDARNGGLYAAASNIPFSAGSSYHFRMVINVTFHTYSAFVTPPGGSELTIASNYAFRTEQAGISSINNFDANVNATPGGSLIYTAPTLGGGSSSSASSSSSSKSSSSSSSSASSKSSSSSSSSSSSKSSSSSSSMSGTTINNSNGFVNSAIANQTGSFTATFDASASVSPANDTLSFSSSAQTAYTGLAATVRFSTTGMIDARNGGAYAAVSSIPFSANTTYHFRMVVNVAAGTYSAYVTAPGGSEQTIATNYAFRTETAGISNINNFNADVNAAPGGSLTYTLPVISGSTSSSSSSSSSKSSSSSSSSTSSSSSSKSSSSSSSSSSTGGGCAATSHDGSFSPDTLNFLCTNTGFDGEQWDNIMKIVNKPEQDSLNWVAAYSYCEDINDGRGFTMGIVGATTGGPNDGGPDGPALFKDFDALKGASNPSTLGGLQRLGITATMSGAIIKFNSADISGNTNSKFCTALHNLQNDAQWRAAIWQSAYDSYISVAVQNMQSRGFKNAATIGSFFDTALNEGGCCDKNSLQGLIDQVGSYSSEADFMTQFHNLRLKIVNTNQYNQSPNGTNRVKQWMQLYTDGVLNLKNADAEVLKVTNWTLK